MKPAWDAVGSAYADSAKVAIVDVDCTDSANEGLCQKQGVQGYPTIKYYEGSDEGADYEGGRDEADIKKFVEETLSKTCSAADQSGCTEDQKKLLGEYSSLSAEEVTKKIEEIAKSIKDKQKWFDESLEKLQETYQNNQKELDEFKKSNSPALRVLKGIAKGNSAKADL